jgi:uncharacterized delta-60 repeat protein
MSNAVSSNFLTHLQHASFAHALRSTLATLFAIVTLSSSGHAAPGDLDTTFGASLNGKVITDFGGSSGLDYAYAMVLQSDGRIVVGGTCAQDFCVARYNADGMPDNTFNGNGRAKFGQSVFNFANNNFEALNDDVRSLALQPDGKIVMAGTCRRPSITGPGDWICIARLLTSGTLDTGFGSSGISILEVPGSNVRAKAVAVQPDGKIVTSGICGVQQLNGTLCLTRFNSDGTVDNSFNANGRVMTALGGYEDTNDKHIAIVQPNGKLVVVWHCNLPSTSRGFCVTRFNTDGSFDGGFNLTGHIATDMQIAGGSSSGNAPRGAVLLSDGKIVVAGTCSYAQAGFRQGVCLAKYNANGSLDLSFAGGSGKLTLTPTANREGGRGLAVQRDGQLVVAGNCDEKFCAFRFFSDGSRQLGFSQATTSFSAGNDIANGIVLQSDGKFVLAGTCAIASDDFCLARYDGAAVGCSLDLDGDGQVQATTDALIATRIALGMTGSSVLNGINLDGKPRSNWNDIRNFLFTQCGMTLAQ